MQVSGIVENKNFNSIHNTSIIKTPTERRMPDNLQDLNLDYGEQTRDDFPSEDCAHVWMLQRLRNDHHKEVKKQRALNDKYGYDSGGSKTFHDLLVRKYM